MKCPLIEPYKSTYPGLTQPVDNDCIKEECAWWDEDKLCCLLRTLTKQVTRLAGMQRG